MRKNFLEKLPADFVPKHQWPEYDILSASPAHFHPEIVGERPKGMRWGIWPFYFEEYFSDEEPDITLSNATASHHRFIVWHRLMRTDKPSEWYGIARKSVKLEGIAFLSPNEAYTSSWSRVARYDRSQWQKTLLNIKYKIEEISFAEFQSAYKKSSVVGKVGDMNINILDRTMHGTKSQYIELRCARDIKSGEIKAGVATVTSKTHGASYYYCAFREQNEKRDPTMTGLIDDWFLRCHKNGIRYVNMGYFWHPGKPEDWKGFSDFKAKFVTDYLLYQPPLIRFA